MAWQLLAAALPAAAQLAGTYLQKPDKKDYQPQTDYMKKYLGYIKGRSAQREVMHMAMQPQLRAIGRQGREMQQQVGYTAERSGVAGSGIEAQMRLSAGQATQEAMTTATEKAVAAQAAETARLGEKAELVTAQIGAEEQRAEQAYDTAGRQWKRQMWGDVLGAGASIASAGISQAGQAKEAAMMATRSGYFGTAEDVQRMMDEGFTPQMFQQEIARMDKLVGAYKEFSRDELIGAQNLMNGGDVPLDINADYTADSPDLALEASAEESAGMGKSEVVQDPVQYKDINTAKQAREAGLEVTEPVQPLTLYEKGKEYLEKRKKKAHDDKEKRKKKAHDDKIHNKALANQAWRVAKSQAYEQVIAMSGEPGKGFEKLLGAYEQEYGKTEKTSELRKERKDFEKADLEGSYFENFANEPEAEEEPVIAAEPEEKVVTKKEVKSVVVPEPDEGREAAVTTVYKNKSYTITIYNKDKTKSKSKTIRFTGNKTRSGKYVFSDKDGKRLDLTLEELNDRLKKK